MPTVKALVLSDATCAAIRARSHDAYSFRDTSLPGPEPGTRYVPFSDDVIERLEAHRFPGESDDDLVLRLLTKLGSGLQ